MLWIIILALLIPSIATAQVFAPFRFSVAGGSSCTDGVDCLCDTISTTSTLLRCEDFEHPGFYEDVSTAFYRSSAGGSSGVTNRGNTSRWFTLYGNGVLGGLFRNTDPTPTLGTACGFSACVGQKEYCSADQGAATGAAAADCWGPGANATAFLDIQRSGDFDAEVTDLTLTGGAGIAEDIGGNETHLALRNGAGEPGGLAGAAYFKAGGAGTAIDFTNFTEVGLTMALAYSPNIFTEANTLLDGPWKHDEWGGSTTGGLIEHWNLGRTGCGDDTEFPYRGFMFHDDNEIEDPTACNAALAAASITVGNADCTDVALRMCSTTAYSQATDFPGGTWACHQAHVKGLGTTDMDIEIKHNGVTVVKIENFDGTKMQSRNYNRFEWNNYANTNDPAGGGSIETLESMYRYEDNVVVVNGPPEPCSAIGM